MKGAICKNHCLGRSLYIHGVPGTWHTMTVHRVLKNLRAEVNIGRMRVYNFVEVNGLKLASPENIYRVIYEALSGHRVGWKKAISIFNERFSEGAKIIKEENRPCILLVDELDLLLTRKQSVLYNIFDWPTKSESKLIIIGIANTIGLLEKFLRRISSRMGIQRLCFVYNQYSSRVGPSTVRSAEVKVNKSRQESMSAYKIAEGLCEYGELPLHTRSVGD
ncbi:hypothetical protein KSP40_PGU021277 [Platanthera guangdongensis]|uniref:Origin recognition complex subunit 1 n=1 Tax=Platanthera guangdongensis TaxID=2320717 RepID=A0ABR2MRJ4_9ASPA